MKYKLLASYSLNQRRNSLSRADCLLSPVSHWYRRISGLLSKKAPITQKMVSLTFLSLGSVHSCLIDLLSVNSNLLELFFSFFYPLLFPRYHLAECFQSLTAAAVLNGLVCHIIERICFFADKITILLWCNQIFSALFQIGWQNCKKSGSHICCAARNLIIAFAIHTFYLTTCFLPLMM